jgi:hypothetical protein
MGLKSLKLTFLSFIIEKSNCKISSLASRRPFAYHRLKSTGLEDRCWWKRLTDIDHSSQILRMHICRIPSEYFLLAGGPHYYFYYENEAR